ncbi:MAG TPA: response regulator transcription factor [Anaerolineaceae bacterium]|nr:response regulator transcription factor [Anaerolineaceae bacterium]
MEQIHILIADDHALFRAGLRALLNLFPDFQVVGEASTGEETIARSEALQPDIILMDIQMPGVNGIEATRRIVHASPNIGIIVVTMFEDNDSVFSAMRAGARGYILKEAGEEEVLRAIRAVARGEAIFGPAIARRLMHFFSKPHLESSQVFPELTEREREILDLIARGETNTKIAEHLVLSPHTVRNHISNIFSKLQVADRAEAIIRAKDAGLGGEKGKY